MNTPILAAAIGRMRDKLDAARESGEISEQDLANAHATLALTPEEHFEWQQIQSHAHAGGDLHTDDALIVYAALGEVGDPGNGLWSAETDLATKYAVTQTVGLLLKRRVAAA